MVLVFHFTTSFGGCLQAVFRTWSNICMWDVFAEIVNGFRFSTVFEKKISVTDVRLARKSEPGWGFEIFILLLFQVHKLSWENTQPENMCDIVFEKSERLWRDSKQNECLCRSSHPKGSFKVSWEISQNSQEILCVEISFFKK